jgi:Icc protein
MSRLFSLLLVISLSGFIYQADAQDCCKKEKFSFVFMTDIHLQPELNADKGLLAAIDKINELNPDFVITGGDLIMDALEQTKDRADSLYLLYKKLQNELDMPVFNTIGNHEHYAFYNKDEINRDDPDYGDKMYRRYMGLPYYSFNHSGWHFISLNSITETEDRRYRGGISEEQVKWLKKDLESVRTETPVVVSVHIPFITGMNQLKSGSLKSNRPGDVINNSKEVLSLFDDKNLKIVLQGHLHYLEDLFMEGKTHFITGGAVCSNWWEGQRYGLEEGFLLVTVEGDEFEWEYIDFDWEVEKE